MRPLFICKVPESLREFTTDSGLSSGMALTGAGVGGIAVADYGNGDDRMLWTSLCGYRLVLRALNICRLRTDW
jgi:hypothetical protein